MKRNIYNGSFKESGNFVTDDYIQKALLESESKVVRKRFIGVIVTLSFTIISYYLCVFLETTEPEIGNVIPTRFGSAWVIICIFIFICYCVKMFNFKNVRILGSYYFNFTMLIAMSLFIVQIFLLALSATYIGANSYLPMFVYPFILFICIVYRNLSINKSIMNILYGDEIYENKYVKYYNKFEKISKKYGGLIVILLFIIRKFFEAKTSTNNERSFLSKVAAVLSPILFIFALIFVISYIKEELVQGFYLKKYCEEYRLKYRFTREEWYGPKSKQFKEEKKGRGL